MVSYWALLNRAMRSAAHARRLASLLAATVRVAGELEPGARPTGLTLTVRTRRCETVVLYLDLDRPSVQKMVEVYGPDGAATLVDLTVPETAEGAHDGDVC